MLDRETLDPAVSRRQFRIGTGDYVALPDEDLHMQSLYADELVVAMAQDHPDVGDAIDHETFLRLSCASFHLKNDNIRSFARMELEMAGLHPRESGFWHRRSRPPRCR